MGRRVQGIRVHPGWEEPEESSWRTKRRIQPTEWVPWKTSENLSVKEPHTSPVVWVSLCVYVCVCVCLSVCLSVCLLCVCLSVCLTEWVPWENFRKLIRERAPHITCSMGKSVCLSVYLCVCLSLCENISKLNQERVQPFRCSRLKCKNVIKC